MTRAGAIGVVAWGGVVAGCDSDEATGGTGGRAGADEGNVFFEGKVVPSGEADDVSNGPALDIPSFAQVTQLAADALGQTMVLQVGTHHPTSEEQALLQEIATAVTP